MNYIGLLAFSVLCLWLSWLITRHSKDPVYIDEVDGKPSGHGLGDKLNSDPDILRLRQLREEAIAAQMPHCLKVRDKMQRIQDLKKQREAAKIVAKSRPKPKPAEIVKIRKEQG